MNTLGGDDDGVLIAGGGHAGVQVADSIRAADPDVAITILDDNIVVPYQRPPLSKSLYAGPIDPLPLRPQEFYARARIRVQQGDPVTGIDVAGHAAILRSGKRLRYRDLILATGARPRQAILPGADLRGVHYLRTVEDAAALQTELGTLQRLTIVGGGFIGLEVAASAAAKGIQVTLLELAPRLLARSISVQSSTWLEQRHRNSGIDFRLGTSAAQVLERDGRVAGVITTDGGAIITDAVLIGIGSQPNIELAASAGIGAGRDGVPVNEYLRTSNPAVWAVGDCAAFPFGASRALRRIESVQNAIDQARRAGTNVVAASRGQALTSYGEIPWFWSQQGTVKIQIAGLADAGSCHVFERRYHDNKLSYLLVQGGRLVAVESLNAPADHLAARKLLAASKPIDITRAVDPDVPLTALLSAASEPQLAG